MPYRDVDDPNLPGHVARLGTPKRKVWIGSFNSVLENCEDGNCEQQAFAVANAAIKQLESEEREMAKAVTERALGGEIKRIDDHTIGGYGVVFSTEDDPDLEQDFFTEQTDFWENHIPTTILMYDHAQGLHPDMIDEAGDIDETKSILPSRYILGHVTKRVKDKHGIWFEAVLDENEEWREMVMELVNQGRLNYSTDSIAHLVEREKIPGKRANWIKSWALPAISLTHAAAEPRALVRAIKRATDRALAEAETQPDESEAVNEERSEEMKGNPVKIQKEQMLQAVFDIYEADILNSAIKSLWFKQEAAVESGDVVAEVEASGQLDDAIKPVAEQLASLVGGLTVSEATDYIRKLIAERLNGGAVDATKQDEDFLDEDPMKAFEDEDEYAMKMDFEDEDDPMKAFEDEDEFAMKMDFGDEDEDFMKALEDEEVPYQTPALKNLDFDPDLVFSYMEAGKRQRGASAYAGSAPVPAYATKSYSRFNINKGAVRHEHGFFRAIKAQMNQDYGYLRRRRRPVYEGYVKHRGKNWAAKALGTTPDTAGGFLVPIEQSSEIIGNLYDESILFSGNLVSRRDMASSELHIPRATSAITVGHIGENTQLSDADVAFGVETLRARKAYAMIRISREELEDSDPDVEQFYVSEIGAAIAEFIDQMTLRGSGSAAQPLGILNRPDVTTTALNAAPTFANLIDAVTRVQQAKIRQDSSWAWIMNPRDTGTLRKLEDTAGNPIWTNDPLGQGAVSANPPRLLGYPVFTTNQLDVDSANNNETEIFFGKWKDVVIGLRKAVEIQTTDQRYFDMDQIAIRAIVRYDVGMYRDEAIEVLTDVRAS